jgi:signal transduction histidine kinase
MNRLYLADLRRQLFTAFLGLLVVGLVFALGIMLFFRGKNLVEEQMKERLKSTASVAAMQFDGAELDKIRTKDDVRLGVFRDTVHRLQEIIDHAPDISSAYLMRRTNDPNILSFIADPSVLLSDAERDTNHNGKIDPDEVAPLPGDPYDVRSMPALRDEAFLRPTTDPSVTIDQWGATISGYAPVMRKDNGKVVAVLGLDMNAKDFAAVSNSTFSSLLFLLILLGGGALAGGSVLYVVEHRVSMLRKLEHERAGLLLLTSHQLGQPLTIFKLSLELLQEAMSKSSELKKAVESHIGNMNEGIYRMNNLLVVLKEAARVEDQTMSYTPTKTTLKTILDVVRAQCAAPLQRKMQRLEFSLSEDVPVSVDCKLVENAILQILDNAMSFSPEGSTIRLSAVRHNGFVHVDVQDEGCGIPAEDIPRIFEKFTRASNASRFKPDGSGLGLFIAKGVIERAGGKIWIQSKENEGTTVMFTLPEAE